MIEKDQRSEPLDDPDEYFAVLERDALDALTGKVRNCLSEGRTEEALAFTLGYVVSLHEVEYRKAHAIEARVSALEKAMKRAKRSGK